MSRLLLVISLLSVLGFFVKKKKKNTPPHYLIVFFISNNFAVTFGLATTSGVFRLLHCVEGSSSFTHVVMVMDVVKERQTLSSCNPFLKRKDKIGINYLEERIVPFCVVFVTPHDRSIYHGDLHSRCLTEYSTDH